MAGSHERKRFMFNFFKSLVHSAMLGNVYTSETNDERAGNNLNILPKIYAIMKKTLAVAIPWWGLLPGANIDDGEVYIDG
jgi:hypothetical protein